MQESMQTHPASPAIHSFRASRAAFLTALAVRLVYITISHAYRVTNVENHFRFGYEMGRIAQALATSRGYADPFHGHTGPTAWIAPLFPLLLAGVFKIFGVYTNLSGWVILAIDSLFNAVMIPLLWEIGVRCFDARVARWSVWIWALYPAAMQYAVRWVWDTTLTTLLLQVALVIALRAGSIGNRAGDGPTWTRWLAFGLVWGLIAVSNPALLIFLPVCGIWILSHSGRLWTYQLAKVVCASLLFIAIAAPWAIRNAIVFHAFVPFRTNFGAELYLGNGPGATGLLMEYNQPGEAPEQLELYRQMGELAYTRWRGQQAEQIIRADLPRFANLCVTRIYFFWFGVPNPSGKPGTDFARTLNYGFTSLAGLLGLALALKRRIPAARLFAAAFVLIPALYYAVASTARFRHQLEPLITLLGVYLFQQAELRWGFSLPVLRKLWPAR
jgi:4-amino-4-deoxy-L-arabinose transferase-like glycosyltransferase